MIKATVNYKQQFGPELTAKIALSIRLVNGENIEALANRVDFSGGNLCYFDAADNQLKEVELSKISGFYFQPTIEERK